jgi:voltage-gated potassium channel
VDHYRRSVAIDDEFDDIGGRLHLPQRQVRPVRQIGWRIAIAASCVIVTTLLVYFERAGYNDNADGEVSVLDAIYYATVTLSTTGYGDITPTSDFARITNVLLITPLRFVFLIVLVGTALEALTRRTQYDWRVRKWRDKMSNHTVIIGFGVKGRSAVKALLDSGMSSTRIVVVAEDDDSIREATEQGLTAVQGDARRESVLSQAGISRASRVVIATDEDATSVLITMLTKRLAPSATVVSAARETSSAQFLRDSGADGVIVTAEAVGRLLSLSLVSPTAGRLMEDLLDSSKGLEVVEREITAAEVGIEPQDLDASGELVLAVIRDGELYRFDGKNIKVFNRADRVVVIRQSANVQLLPDLGPAT